MAAGHVGQIPGLGGLPHPGFPGVLRPAPRPGSWAPGTWGDYLLCLFGGMEPPRGLFQAPFLWLLLHLGILFFTLPYLRGDLGGLGQQLLLRAGNRTAWWLSKCLWNAAAVVLFYLIALGR